MLGNREAKRRGDVEKESGKCQEASRCFKDNTSELSQKKRLIWDWCQQGVLVYQDRGHLPVCKIEDQETSGRNAGQEEASVP